MYIQQDRQLLFLKETFLTGNVASKPELQVRKSWCLLNSNWIGLENPWKGEAVTFRERSITYIKFIYSSNNKKLYLTFPSLFVSIQIDYTVNEWKCMGDWDSCAGVRQLLGGCARTANRKLQTFHSSSNRILFSSIFKISRKASNASFYINNIFGGSTRNLTICKNTFISTNKYDIDIPIC
jgi:hypothetical protein